METIVEACRLCAKLYANPKELEFVHLFEPYTGLENEVQFILEQLKSWRLEVHAGDGLPQRICANCFDSFCNIDVFRQECLNAQQSLLQYFVEANANDLKAAQAMDANEAEISGQLQPADGNALVLSAQQTTNINPNALNITTELNLNTNMDAQNDLNAYEFNNNNNTKPDITNQIEMLENIQLLPSIAPNDVYYHPTQIAETRQESQHQQSQTCENAISSVSETTNLGAQDLEEMLESSVIHRKLIPKTPPPADIINTKVAHNWNANLQKTAKQPAAEEVNSRYDEGNDLNTSIEMENSPATLVSGIPLACQYCYCHSSEHISQLIYPDADALSQHYFDVHDPNLPFNCPYCSEAFKSPKPRDYHVTEMHRSVLPVTECEYCHKVIRTTNEMHQYCCTYVSDWHCNVCDEHFPNMPLSRYRAHQRQHKSTKQHRCRHCGREFVRRANLEAHERTHRVEHVIMVQCSSCKATFSSEYELRRHKYQMHSGEMPVKCEYCGKGFASIAFYNRHMLHLHPDKLNDRKLEGATTCNNCGQNFKSVLKLRYHLQRPRDENGNCTTSPTDLLNEEKKEKKYARMQGLFPCGFCAKRFFMKSQLEKHLKTHDASLRPHQCDQCPVRCRTTYELQEHVNVAHLRLKAHECKTCGKRFGYRKDLVNHELFHAELKVRCKEEGCHFICRSDKALSDHIRQKHRPIPCEYCGIPFTRQRLMGHLRDIHSDEIQNDVAGMGHVSISHESGDGKMHTANINNNNNNNNYEDNNTTESILNDNEFFATTQAAAMEADQYFANNID